MCGYVSNIYVDAVNPKAWEALKREFGERYEWQYQEQVAYCRKYGLYVEDQMFIVPFPIE